MLRSAVVATPVAGATTPLAAASSGHHPRVTKSGPVSVAYVEVNNNAMENVGKYHEGAGFANFPSQQAASAFAGQLSDAVARYGLDGIDLDDEYADYGNNGTGQPNDSSFVYLVSALRDGLPGKLLTFCFIGPSASRLSYGTVWQRRCLHGLTDRGPALGPRALNHRRIIPAPRQIMRRAWFAVVPELAGGRRRQGRGQPHRCVRALDRGAQQRPGDPVEARQ